MVFGFGTVVPALIAAMLIGAPVKAQGDDGLKAWFERVVQGEMVSFEGYVSAPDPMLVNYRLTILRIGSGGQSKTSQGGRVEISAANEPTRLSTTAINLGPDDFYEVELVATGTNGEEVRVEFSRRPEDAQ